MMMQQTSAIEPAAAERVLHSSLATANRRTAAREEMRSRVSGGPMLEFVIGDITQQVTDALVNPVGGGLVDLAVRRAAGFALTDAFHNETARLAEGKLSAGQVILTPGFGLQASHVIHCGPPVYADDPSRARQDLVACYARSLRLACAHGFASIAFPAIGTGVYRYPAREAAAIALDTVATEAREHGAPALVRFVLFDRPTLDLYVGAARSAQGA